MHQLINHGNHITMEITISPFNILTFREWFIQIREKCTDCEQKAYCGGMLD